MDVSGNQGIRDIAQLIIWPIEVKDLAIKDVRFSSPDQPFAFQGRLVPIGYSRWVERRAQAAFGAFLLLRLPPLMTAPVFSTGTGASFVRRALRFAERGAADVERFAPVDLQVEVYPLISSGDQLLRHKAQGRNLDAHLCASGRTQGSYPNRMRLFQNGPAPMEYETAGK